MLSDEIEKSIDMIVYNWMSKTHYWDITEGEIRNILYKLLNPMLEEIKLLENEISDSHAFGLRDTDELIIELSHKKMNYIRKISELMKIS